MLLDYNEFHWHDMHAVRFGPIQVHPKPEPIMLLVLPIIPSRNSQNFYPLFLFYSHAITYYSCYIL